MKTILKPILLISAALVAGIVIVFCCALFWIQSNHGRQWVQARINTAIPGKITIERYRLSLVHQRLDLYRVVLHDSEGVALAGFDHLSVQLDGWSLWRREIRLEHTLLHAPWAELTVDEATGLNLIAALVPPAPEKKTEAPAPDSTGWPFNVVFESTQLSDGRFTFKPSDPAMHLEINGLSLGADGNLMARSGNLELVVDNVRFSSAGIRPEPARIALKASLDGDQLNLSALEVTAGQTRLRLSGSAQSLYTTPRIDSILSVESQLDELKTIFNLAGDHSGPVNTQLTLKGAVANPDARLVLGVGGGRIAGQPLDRGDLSIDLNDRLVTIESAALRLAEGIVNLKGTLNLRDAFPDGFLAPPSDANAITYALTLDQNIPDLNPWLKPYSDIGGKMTGRVSVSGSGINPAGISARLTMTESGHGLLTPGMARPVDADVNLSAQIAGGRISISRLNASADGIELSGEGRFQMEDKMLAGKLSLTAEDLSRVLAVVGGPSVNGACKATLTVDGSLNRPQFSVDLASKNLNVDTYVIGDLTVKANMDHEGRLNLDTLDVQNRASRIQGNGRLRLLPDGGGIDPQFTNTLALTLETLSPADFMESAPVNGTLDGRLQVDGPLGTLTGALSLNGKALGTEGIRIGDIDARVRLNAGTIFVDRLHLRNQDSTLKVAGSIQVLVPGTLRTVAAPTVDVTVDSDHLDPGDFIDAASGDFTFTGVLKGNLEKPVGRLTLKGRQVNLAGQAIETVSLDARVEDRRLWLDRFIAAVTPGEQIEGGGSVGLDKTIDLQVRSTGVSSSGIQRLQDIFPGEGMLHLDATGKGTIANPDIDGHLTVSDMIINDGAIEDVNLTFSLHDMLARVTGNLNFDIDAACDLKKGDFDARLTFDRTEVGSYFRAAGRPGFHGQLSGRIEAAGNIRDAANVSAQVDLTALQIMFEKMSLVQSDKIALQLADQKLSITDFELAILSEGHLRLQGDAHIGGRLDLTADGRIPLAVVKNVNDTLTGATGVVTLKGNVSGNMDAPRIDARIDLEKIGMAIPGLVHPVRNLNGRIHLDGERVRIEKLEGFLDTGSFSVAGVIDHDYFEPVGIDLKANAGALPLEIDDTLAVLVNGDIQIKGNNRSAEANGEIILLEGLYYKDININLLKMASSATTRQRTVAPATRSMTIPYFGTVNLNISIGHRQPFVVQNNLADFEISPALKIGGTLANPIVSGRAEVQDGTVIFQRKDFDIKKGVIYFINPYKTEVEIDIDSETQISSWKINLAIKGTPDNLEFQLTSQPQEAEADILSLILFGRTAQELTAGEGGATRTTGQIMAEMIADTYGNDLKKSTGVDILQVESTNGSNGEDAGGIKVTVGKHLSDRMTVKYAIETISGETKQWAIMEYKLLERILVNGAQSTSGLFGAELVYRIEFR